MPKVFISYSREDLKLVKKLGQFLLKHEYIVWRDQESIYGGQNWPKRIGEEIYSSDYFLLVLSKHSKKSHFVEFEWTTAVDLKKHIIPYSLDETQLPASLSALNCILSTCIESDFANILDALKISEQDTYPNQNYKIIKKFDGIKLSKPEEVVHAIQEIIKQEATNVYGSVYQAGRDVIINPIKNKRTLGKFIGFLLGVISIIVIIINLMFNWPLKPKSARLYGNVKCEDGIGVSGAKIIVRSKIDSPPIGTGVCGSKGVFDFPIKERWGETVYVTIILGDSIGFEDYITLTGGNKVFPFKPFKKKP